MITYIVMAAGVWLLIVSGICAVLMRCGVRARDRKAGVTWHS